MDVEPDPVTHPVPERGAEPGCLDRAAARGVDLTCERTGYERRPAGLLGLEHHRVRVQVTRRRLSGYDGAAEIGAVAAVHAAEVEHHALALADRLRAGGVRRVVPEPREDVGRERRAAGAADRQLVLDVLLQLAHRDAGHHPRGRGGHRGIGHAAGGRHQLELEVRLDAAQARHERAAVHDLRARQGVLEAERRPRRRACADGDLADVPESCSGRAEQRIAVVQLVDDDELAGLVAAEMERDEHARQDEQRLPPGDEEGSRDPVVGVDDLAEARQVALDAGQVLEVGRRRQEEGVDPLALESRVQALAARRPFSCESLVHPLESRSSAVRLARRAGLVMGCSDRLGLGRAPLAEVDREHDHRADGEELGLPVLERLLPEVGVDEVVAPGDRGEVVGRAARR